MKDYIFGKISGKFRDKNENRMINSENNRRKICFRENVSLIFEDETMRRVVFLEKCYRK